MKLWHRDQEQVLNQKEKKSRHQSKIKLKKFWIIKFRKLEMKGLESINSKNLLFFVTNRDTKLNNNFQIIPAPNPSSSTSTKLGDLHGGVRSNTPQKHTIMKICTLNTRTLLGEDRIWELEYALKNIKWDIIGLSEVRKNHDNIEERISGNVLCYSAGKAGNYGVGFLIKNIHKNKILEFVPYNERIAILKVDINSKQTLTLFQIYAPTESSTQEEIENMYEQIYEIFLQSDKKSEILIMGDFNSRVGKKLPGEERTMGHLHYGKRNDRGTLLIEFAASINFKIGNTFFGKKRMETRWTWQSPTGFKAEMDYILFKNKQTVQNIEVIQNIKFNSDHRMLRATLKFSKINRSKRFTKNRILKITEEQKHEYKDELKIRLKNLKHVPHNTSIQMFYNEVEKSITSSVPKPVPSKKRENKITNETLKLIEKRENMKKLRNKSPCQKIEYCEIKKLTKKQIKEDIKKYNERKIDEIISEHGAVKKLRKELSVKKDWVLKTISKEGDCYNRNDILKEATKYFKQLYSKTSSNKTEIHLSTESVIPIILKDEIVQAIKELKNHKSPGSDGITNELIKYGEEELLETLQVLFNNIIEKEQIPSQWTHSQIVLLHKKGPKELIKNYRPISLSSCSYKIFTKIILKRINRTLEEYNSIDQAGFRKGFSTNDHLQTINQIIEKSKEYNFPLYMAFVDFEKAFDSIDHQSILEALVDAGVEHKYIRIIREIYNKSTAQIVLEKPGPSFDICRGVRQGDPLSPILFTCVLEKIFKELEWDEKGIKLDGRFLSNLRFADDIVLFATSNQDLNTMLRELEEKSIQVGLSLNKSKTKTMANNNNLNVKLSEEEIENVNQYIYLGQTISFKNKQEEELSRRIAIAWSKYWSLKQIFKGKLDMKVKKKIYDACILPTLTYGCQTWSLSKKQLNRIATCQRKMERSMLGLKLKDRVKNKEIRKRTNVVDVAMNVRRLKWKWAGHLLRTKDERWSKAATLWVPRDRKRRRGRQFKRWRDELDQHAGKLWIRETRNRQVWKDLGEAYTSLEAE